MYAKKTVERFFIGRAEKRSLRWTKLRGVVKNQYFTMLVFAVMNLKKWQIRHREIEISRSYCQTEAKTNKKNIDRKPLHSFPLKKLKTVVCLHSNTALQIKMKGGIFQL